MKVLVINGPNLNLLGKRKAEHYGAKTLQQIQQELVEVARAYGLQLIFYQSNHEGELIDKVQAERDSIDGILINAGALSHYGYALRDALIDAAVPIVTVHLSNIYSRPEAFRQHDLLASIAVGGVYGFKSVSYTIGLQALMEHLKQK